ncbi:MAG: NUDIX hydrolase [Alphaproteobacteria bacterium]|nr:NUDIX hydrolase [Alphaproteobacteria bacterium]
MYSSSSSIQQAAALPIKRSGSNLRVLLVTSRQDGRWILPKGQIEDGESPAEGAAREAFEEAGVKGRTAATPLGTYSYLKQITESRAIGSQVVVFPMLVRKELRRWPEMKQRKRRWVTLDSAAKKVGDRGLAKLLRELDDRDSRKALRKSLDGL